MASPNAANEQLLELLLTLKKTTPAAARGILNSQPAIAYALISLMVSMNAINIEVFQKTLQEYGANNSADSSSTAATTTSGPPAISTTPSQSLPPPAAPAPISAVPPHVQAQYRTTTPPTAPSSYSAPTHTPTPPYGYPANGQSHSAHPTPPSGYSSYGQQNYQQQGYNYSQPPYQQQGYQQSYSQPAPSAAYPGYPPYGHASHSQAPTPASGQATSAALPDSLAGIPDEQKALIMRVISMTPEQINMLPPNERSTYIQIRTTLGVPTPTG
ncbi:hypothetical protein CVT26_008747 [Gymnopilus dilepis]|uniref:Transcription termination and cleavage factor C-terminal domain-containing protein n=1 Tax=Gymnopilus dilepis TaxID=231916 RepID=A0A409YG68_9AGAR|nr:hypothetical protein CVT26_008747 [Gymnopilus dilepis]